MSAVLSLRRGGYSIELRRRLMEIALDGTRVGTIAIHGTFETPIKAGRHTLRLRSGRYSSRVHSFEVPDGEIANFQCHSAMLWPIYAISLVKTDWAISLRRV